MAAMDSKKAFEETLAKLELSGFAARLAKMGVTIFADLAFCTSAGDGAKDGKGFEDVIAKLSNVDTTEEWAAPRLRRLYHSAYAHAAADLETEAQKDPAAKIHMHPADRAERVEKLRARVTGWKLSGDNMPSSVLIDRWATMLAKGVVKYCKWEHCTTRAAELMEEPELKMLRVIDNSLLMQDVQPDKTTEISGEILWDLALRRRSAAAEIAGVCTFDSMDAWSEVLKGHLMAKPVPGYRRTSWGQLRAADEALFLYVASACESGLRAVVGNPLTRFELKWKEGMYDISVRQLLAPLQGGSSTAASSSSPSAPPPPANEMKKLSNQLKQAQEQIAAQKRRLEDNGIAGRARKPRTDGWDNGKGNGKGKAKGARSQRRQGGKAPDGWGDLPTVNKDNERYCFKYNSSNGCPLAPAGGTCFRGRHQCPKCGGSHPKDQCDGSGSR